ncbi:hypothetical protein O3M35_001177 [Rhynocoris fuscipes]|uniref:Uncharacterized protein n=1 Tax=Rhynocoris fuscipes TaxID=488301 RepID=A0AAW1DQ26_9HEMI
MCWPHQIFFKLKNLIWPTHDFLEHLFNYKIFVGSSYVISCYSYVLSCHHIIC